jgi:hypothetical protein
MIGFEFEAARKQFVVVVVVDLSTGVNILNNLEM